MLLKATAPRKTKVFDFGGASYACSAASARPLPVARPPSANGLRLRASISAICSAWNAVRNDSMVPRLSRRRQWQPEGMLQLVALVQLGVGAHLNRLQRAVPGRHTRVAELLQPNEFHPTAKLALFLYCFGSFFRLS